MHNDTRLRFFQQIPQRSTSTGTTNSDTMSQRTRNIGHDLLVVPEAGLIVCTLCESGVRPGQVGTHMVEQHKWPRAKAREAADAASEFADMDATGEEDVANPDGPVEAIPGLRIYSDGVDCPRCVYVCRSMETMRRHFKETHKSEEEGDRFDYRNHQQGIHCQKRYPSGSGSAFFKVKADDIPNDVGVDDGEGVAGESGEWYKVGARRLEDADRCHAAKVAEGTFDEVNPWLEKVRWAEVLKGWSVEELQTLSYPREIEEVVDRQREQDLLDAVVQGVDTAYGHVFSADVGHPLRRAIMMSGRDQVSVHPLKAYRYRADLGRHCLYWRKVFAFFYRALEVGLPHPEFTFGEGESDAWDAMMSALRDIPPRSTDTCLLELGQLCTTFIVELIKHQSFDVETKSPMYMALAVQAISPTGWSQPEDFTSPLSAVLKVGRVVVLHHLVTQPGLNHQEVWRTVSAFVAEYMAHGSATIFGWMLEVRAFGMAIARSNTNLGQVTWQEGDVLGYRDIQFSLSAFRSMLHSLVETTRKTLKNELLLDPPTAITDCAGGQLFDDLANQAVGWSFLQDRRNVSLLKHDGTTWLAGWVSADPNRVRLFVSHGKLSQPKVTEYLAKVYSFLKDLLVLVHITGGQPARGPELLSIRHRNTQQGGTRNVFVVDGAVMVKTVYHKGYNVSRKAKHICRFLPPAVSEMMVSYLWLVLPWKRLLEFEVFGFHSPTSHVWPSEHHASEPDWSSTVLSRHLERVSRVPLDNQVLNIQSYRQIAVAISRRFMGEASMFDKVGCVGNESDDEVEDTIVDLQAGHSSRTAQMRYGRSLTDMFGLLPDEKDLFRAASLEWHHYLGFETSGLCSLPMPWEESTARRSRVRMRFDQATVSRELKVMLGTGAKFRGLQEQALKHIMSDSQSSYLLAVMPTGGGKSLLFLLPARISRVGTTVVIVPLVALRSDLYARCAKLGISCSAWEAGMQPDSASIVLVTPESFVSGTFQAFLRRLKTFDRLERIVVDECHLVATAKPSFRPELGELGMAVKWQCPILMLTATLPPSLEPQLFKTMGLQPDDVVVLRSSTRRTNVKYTVARRYKTVADLAVLVGEMRRQYNGGKIIIYATTLTAVDEISREIGCAAYTAKASNKSTILGDLQAGRIHTVAATNALGMGVDIPDIRAVIHYGCPYSLLDFAQESGRAGRDGKPAQSVLMPIGGTRDMADFVNEEQCRRLVLDKFLDADDAAMACQEGEMSCDRCTAAARARPPTRPVLDHCDDSDVEVVDPPYGLG